ncbi:hypothetical protein GGF37_004872 [Kickxella alabastrina]|nr:hypothetical protein GGF37_004872 [Kickxella alabastrina]
MFDTESRLRAESVLKLAVDAILQTTKDWVAKPDVAGYIDQPRAQATDAFRSATLALDPYIRARFLTERTA